MSIGVPPPFGVSRSAGTFPSQTASTRTVCIPAALSATSVEISTFPISGGKPEVEVRTPLTQSLAGTWWGAVPLAPGDHYGIRVTGPDNDPQKLLIDPWARALDGPIDWRSDPAALRSGSGRDSAPFVPRAVVVDEKFNHGTIQRPHTKWTDTVLYEVHVKGATMHHPEIPPHLRGTYAGFAHPA